MEKQMHQESAKRSKKKKNKEQDYYKQQPEDALQPATESYDPFISPKSSKHKNRKSKKHSQPDYVKQEVDDDFMPVQLITTPRKKKSKGQRKSSPIISPVQAKIQQCSSDEEPGQVAISTPRKWKADESSPKIPKIEPNIQELSSDEEPDDVPMEVKIVVPGKGKSKPNMRRASSDEELEDEESQNVSELDIRSVPKVDLQMLLDHIQQCIPKEDAMRAQSRCKRIDWSKVAFGEYSPAKCVEMWRLLAKCVRPHRTLNELIGDAKIWLENPSPAYSKVSDHPEYPKRPRTAFTEYLLHVKDEIMRQNSGVKVAQLTRLASISFKALSESKRSIYMEKAQKNLRHFEEQLRAFYMKHPELKSDDVSKVIGPKKPLTPFSHFVEFQIEKEQLVADKTIVRKASKPVWEKLKPNKKLKWIRMASEEQKTYLEELEKYNQEHPDDAIKPMKNVLNKLETQILDQADGKPTKPPSTAYMVYLQQSLKNHADEFTSLTFSNKIRTIAAKWKLLPKEEKAHFTTRQQQLQEKYDTEFAAYLESLPETERQKAEEQNAGSAKKRRGTKKKESLELDPKRSKSDESSRHNLTIDAIPSHWDTMSEEDRKVYTAAVARLRDYFEAKNNDTSIKEEQCAKQESSSESEETEKSSSGSSSESSESDSD